MSTVATFNRCDPNQYEGDVEGFLDHLVVDHGVPADYVAPYRRKVTEGNWLNVWGLHQRVLAGRYVPRHRRMVLADSPATAPHPWPLCRAHRAKGRAS